MTLRNRWLVALGALGCAALVLTFAVHFPWRETARILAGARWSAVAGAVALHLASVLAKGWAWHLLLRPSAPHRFRSAQVATLVGAAVNCVTVSVGGEATRVHVLARRDGVGYGVAAASVFASRVTETFGLALCVCFATAMLPPEAWADDVKVAAWSILTAGVVVWWWGLLPRLAAKLPAAVQVWVAPILAAPARVRLAAPVALGVINWLAQWGATHLCLLSAGLAVPATASLATLLLANIGGAARLTPGNIGVLQAALFIALTPFGVDAPRALAAGVILQAVLTLPVVLIGVALAVGSFGTLLARRTDAATAPVLRLRRR